ncbi:acetyl-CoA synthetase-like protein [Mycena olivaceomarginata]|nr:acetyl-CoA synthetase-like protein [Mycena olivaceomarginata]
MLNAEELNPFLIDMKPALLFVHSVALEVVRAAATLIGLPHDRIVLLDSASEKSELHSLQELVDIGLANKETHRFEEFRLRPGGGKTKVALYFPLSGTTVVPKMAAIPHASIIANILQNAAHDAGTNELTIPIIERRFRPGDASLAVLPFFHIFGLLINLHYHIFSGAPKFDLKEYLSTIKQYKANHLSLVLPIMVLFCKHPAVKAEDLTSLRTVYVGGAPAVVEQSYGMTEVAECLRATEGGPGQTGELYIKGPSLAIHYVNNPEISAATFIDGWVRSGDECYFDEDGEIYVVDRIKDFIIKVRSFQVAPAELEARLAASSDVADCCVVLVPHEFSGEIPKAYDITENKSKFKALAGGLEFIESIPRNAAGKLLGQVLRAKALEDARLAPVV